MNRVPLLRTLPRSQIKARDDYIRGMLEYVILPLDTFIRSRVDDDDAPLPVTDYPILQGKVRELTSRFFIGRTGAAFDGAAPQSAFAVILARAYANTIYEVVLAHKVWMQRYLPASLVEQLETVTARPIPIQRPQDLVDDIRTLALRMRTRNAEMVVRETEDILDFGFTRDPENISLIEAMDPSEANALFRIFRPNPLATINPRLRWLDMTEARPYLDNDGNIRSFRLSDSIWSSAVDTEVAIDRILQRGLREGRSAVKLAELIDPYLLPEAREWETFAPYEDFIRLSGDKIRPGYSAFNYHAMRLVRTELSRAHNMASYHAARSNPYVSGVDWALSPRHPRVDICDDYATWAGGRLKPAYTFENARVPPAHPHCICTSIPAMIQSSSTHNALLADKISEIMAGRDLQYPISNPMQIRDIMAQFLDQALHQFLPIDMRGVTPRRFTETPSRSEDAQTFDDFIPF